MSLAPAAFRIHVPDRVLDDLQVRLQRTRWSRLDDVAGWELGTDRASLRELVSYWRTHFDWRACESQLDELLPQRTTRAHGVDIHFAHVAARRPHAMPLLLLHGWPDSFLRYRRVVRALALDFEVIVPSLPGYGFSGPVQLPASEPLRHCAEILSHLMRDVLGFDYFAVAGGDLGGQLAQILAIDHPENIAGIHLTDLGSHVGATDPSTVTHAERRWLAGTKHRLAGEQACASLVRTRPRSLAAALADSPAGLASWIADRFHARGAELDRDDLLANIMIYWVTNTIGSAMQVFAADRRSPTLSPANYVERPVAFAATGEPPPRRLAERTLNIAWWSELPRGGELAALVDPERYATDVAEFFRALEGRRHGRKEHRDDRPAV